MLVIARHYLALYAETCADEPELSSELAVELLTLKAKYSFELSTSATEVAEVEETATDADATISALNTAIEAGDAEQTQSLPVGEWW